MNTSNKLILFLLYLCFYHQRKRKMTTTSEYNYYKLCIDKCVSEMNECKDNQKREDLLRYINHCQNDIQTLYDIGDFDLELSALEPEPEPEPESDGEYTDEQRKCDM